MFIVKRSLAAKLEPYKITEAKMAPRIPSLGQIALRVFRSISTKEVQVPHLPNLTACSLLLNTLSHCLRDSLNLIGELLCSRGLGGFNERPRSKKMLDKAEELKAVSDRPIEQGRKLKE